MRPYQIVAAEQILRRIETSTNLQAVRHPRGRRLHLAHDRLGQDPDELQGRPAGHQAAVRRQGAVRRRPQGPRLPDDARVRALRERCRQLQHLHRASSRSSWRTRTPGSSSPRSRSWRGSLREPRSTRSTAGTSWSSSMSATAASSATCTPRSPRRSSATTCSASPARRSSPTTPPTGGAPTLRTTEQAFGDKLHTYTIVDAINDKNVLPFRIDYINTVKTADGVTDKQVSAIDTEKALLAPERIGQVVDYVLDHFDQKTNRAQHYRLGDKRVFGFNSLFATASIEAAKRYYNVFEARTATDAQPPTRAYQRLKIGIIFSYAANEDLDDGLLAEEEFETGDLDGSSRGLSRRRHRGLQRHVRHQLRHVARSVSRTTTRICRCDCRSRELDLVIVVNMFLTGFDATTLNTLWVDKNLRQHGLIQAYSRTNRILNSVKTYGNIICFRDLEEATNDALALFGNKDAQGIVFLKPYADYHDEYATKRGRPGRSSSRSAHPSSARPTRRTSSACSAPSFGCATSSRPSTTSPARRSSPPASFRTTRASISICSPSSARSPTRRRSRSTTTSSSRSS